MLLLLSENKHTERRHIFLLLLLKESIDCNLQMYNRPSIVGEEVDVVIVGNSIVATGAFLLFIIAGEDSPYETQGYQQHEPKLWSHFQSFCSSLNIDGQNVAIPCSHADTKNRVHHLDKVKLPIQPSTENQRGK